MQKKSSFEGMLNTEAALRIKTPARERSAGSARNKKVDQISTRVPSRQDVSALSLSALSLSPKFVGFVRGRSTALIPENGK